MCIKLSVPVSQEIHIHSQWLLRRLHLPTRRGIPKGFIHVTEPPRIGAGTVQQPQPLQLPTATPTTPAHPPRPPISALPQPVQEPPAPLKHPLPQPAQQSPPNKHPARKHFQREQMVNPLSLYIHFQQLILQMWELRVPKALQFLWCQLY